MNFLIRRCLLIVSTFYSAYEDKQHSKRKEISCRSWFGSPSASPAGAAGSLLHKLSLQGKEAALAKALGSSHSPLIRKRTGGVGTNTEPCSTITRKQSHPEINTPDVHITAVTQTEEAPTPTQVGREAAEIIDGDSTKTRVKTTEEADEGLTKRKDRSLGAFTSLVADYSDSDSEPGQ